jgi:hypothetical protein
VTRLFVVLILVCSFGDAHAGATWWQQFYVRLGYRTALGLDRTTAPSLAVGYRVEGERWALDLGAFDVQRGMDEGVHELGQLALVRRQPLGRGVAWLSLGAGYSIARGWAETEFPRRRGQGVQLDLAVGYDLNPSCTVRWFGRLGVGAPLYALHDPYGSVDSRTYVVPVELGFGARF